MRAFFSGLGPAAPDTPTDIIEDSIWLDTTIAITDFSHDASGALGLGDTVHCRLDGDG